MTAETTSSRRSSVFQAVLDWVRRTNLERSLAIVLLVLGVFAGTATFSVMTGDLPIEADSELIYLLLISDLILLLGISALIARRLALVWNQRKRGQAGARLHGRMVALFGVVAVMPVIVVTIFSVALFDFGLKNWFSERVSTAIKNSLKVADAYREEHQQAIFNDALAIAQRLNRSGPTLVYSPRQFNQAITQQADLRSLTEAAVYDSTGRLLARASGFLLAFNPEIPDWAFEKAREGEVVIMTAETEERVRALIRLDVSSDAYLYVGRLVDPRVLGHLDRTRGAVERYETAESKSRSLQLTAGLIFGVVAMFMLLAAMWLGIAFANYITVPIGNLIAAAERIRAGDLTARVVESGTSDEIENLSLAFNSMTQEMESQRSELLEANRQLDYRSRFIEAVLGGVSAGVIGLDKNGEITLPNRSACELLKASVADLRGRRLAQVLPEMADLIDLARRRPNRLAENHISLDQEDGASRMLRVRVAAEADGEGIIGFVVTFDDITELLAAQRKAAWSDIARRIAHEIKNPLTPIQLSAERLKRKYLKQIHEEPETFEICTDTIIRHVGDIGRMVDEFSSFARMPAPVMSDENLGKLIAEAVFLQEGAHPDIVFEKELPEQQMIFPCDSQQIGRALTNLLLNAVEAIKGQEDADPATSGKGRIVIKLVDKGPVPVIEITDNGPGLPRNQRHLLTEPYVTTRDRGTGLGLAIVKKIMEDHGGELTLEDHPDGGARVSLVFAAGDEAAVALPATAGAERRDSENPSPPLTALDAS